MGYLHVKESEEIALKSTPLYQESQVNRPMFFSIKRCQCFLQALRIYVRSKRNAVRLNNVARSENFYKTSCSVVILFNSI